MIHVYIGDFGEYPIPDGVMAEAVALNAGKRLADRRTRGNKLLAVWGKTVDALVCVSGEW